MFSLKFTMLVKDIARCTPFRNVQMGDWLRVLDSLHEPDEEKLYARLVSDLTWATNRDVVMAKEPDKGRVSLYVPTWDVTVRMDSETYVSKPVAASATMRFVFSDGVMLLKQPLAGDVQRFMHKLAFTLGTERPKLTVYVNGTRMKAATLASAIMYASGGDGEFAKKIYEHASGDTSGEPA